MARSFHSPADLVTQSARLRLALRCLQIVAFGMGLLELAIGLSTSSRTLTFLGLETLGLGVLALLAIVLVSRGQLSAAVSMLCMSFFAATIGAVFVMPSALTILVLAPILAMAISLPYLSGRALRGIAILARLVASDATVLVIDDDPHACEIVTSQLRQVGAIGWWWRRAGRWGAIGWWWRRRRPT